jgi:hypothetical protein
VNYTRIVLAGAATWVASLVLGYLINNVWLLRLYQANAWAFRRADEMNPLLPIGFVVQLLAAMGFAYAYARGYQRNREASGIAQGVRFGLLISLIIDGFAVAWNYVTEPIAPRLGLLEVLSIVGQFGVYGAIVGLIYHPSRLSVRGVDEKYDLRG